METIYLESAMMEAERAQARADCIHDAVDAAVKVRDDIRRATGISTAAEAIMVVIDSNIDALREQARKPQAEADRLANISNGLDRLSCRV